MTTYSIIHSPERSCKWSWRGLTGASTGNQTSVFYIFGGCCCCIDMSAWCMLNIYVWRGEKKGGEYLGKQNKNWGRRRGNKNARHIIPITFAERSRLNPSPTPTDMMADGYCIQWGTFLFFSLSLFYASHHRVNVHRYWIYIYFFFK